MGFFVWVCELMGGMNSVALTDAVQAGILVFCFMLTPMLLESKYGGFEGIAGETCQNLCWYDTTEDNETAAVYPNGTSYTVTETIDVRKYGGCLYHVQNWIFQHPARSFAWLLASLCLTVVGGCVNPMAMHRTMVAKSDKALGQGMSLVEKCHFICFRLTQLHVGPCIPVRILLARHFDGNDQTSIVSRRNWFCVCADVQRTDGPGRYAID